MADLFGRGVKRRDPVFTVEPRCQDADVLIDYLRGAGPGLALVDHLRGSVAYLTTAVTAFELAAGRSYARDRRPVDALLRAPVLRLTRGAAVRAGLLFHTLASRGKGIEVRDAMQAGICLDADMPLVTRNVSHFRGVAGLQVLTPDEWLRRVSGPKW